jgi:YVTN family beta-propeller protein
MRECVKHSKRFVILLPLFLTVLWVAKASSKTDGGGRSADLENVKATLPNGRLIAPAGAWVTVAPFPFALTVRPDGKQLVTPSLGFPFALNIVDHLDSSARRVTQIPPGFRNADEVQVYTGVVYSPDGKLLYDATGDSGAVDILSTDSWKKVGRIELNGTVAGRTFKESFASSLILSGDGRQLYVIDEGNWRIAVIDTATRNLIASLNTGVNPIALCLSPNGKRLYLANSGLFEYQLVPGVDRADRLHTGLHYPPFAYPSKEAEKGAIVEGRKIAALGNENDPRGSSLWTYDVSDAKNSHLLATLRLGPAILPGKNNVVGGAAPSAVVAQDSAVYVAIAHDDAVAVVSPDGTRIETQISLTPFPPAKFADRQGHPLRGVMPSGLALQGKHLFVTEAGIAALAVVDTDRRLVLGHLPVGWNPSAVAVSPDGQTIYVANSKGKGTGPNGGSKFDPALHGSYIGDLELGSISVIPSSLADKAGEMTASVLRNNQEALEADKPLPHLKYVFLIIRENRTFDEIFGDLAGADGDPSLGRYGLHGQVKGDPAMQDLKVTPNAHVMASSFATSDNYYTESDVSADGHRWALGVAPTPWMNIAWASSYGRRRHSDAFSDSPGRRAMSGATDAPMPEDEPEFGSLWEHVSNGGLQLMNYGESLEVEGMDEMPGSEPEGHRLALNSPLPRPIFASTDRTFPTANMGIPDIFRYQEFHKDFTQRFQTKPLPSLTVIRLGNDHTANPRPADGYPLRESYVADNDLALGQMIEFLSHSPIWKDSAVFVTEDDPQSGVDHVDAHRSVLLVMGPHVKRGYISHRHSSMASIQKTIYELLGLGPLNLEDALAADLSDMFTLTPDLKPFDAVSPDPRIFVPSQARFARPKNAKEAADLSDIDDAQKIRKEFGAKKPDPPGGSKAGTPANTPAQQ